MAQRSPVDVAILGAGSGGENLASQLIDRGLSVALVEERLVGGECPYFACMPSKAMLHDAFAGQSFAHAALRRDEVAEHYDDTAHAEHLTGKGVDLHRGRGRLTGHGTLVVEAPDGMPTTIEARHIVIATGADERTLDVPGMDAVTTWSSEDAWTASELPASLLVVGAGPVGVEVATAYRRFGASVTVINRSNGLLSGEDPEVADRVQRGLVDAGVELVLGAEVVELAAAPDGRTKVTLSDASVRAVERVATCVGKIARVDGIGLEHVGLSSRSLEVGTDGRVAGVEGLWAIGDVTGMPAFTHTANALADVIAHNLAEPDDEARHIDLDAMPRCVFVEPALAAVGSTAPSNEHVRVSIDLANIARGYADATQHGFAVLSARRDDGRVAGFSAVGPGMEDAVTVATLAIQQRLTVDDLARLVAPFPTYSEVVPVLAARARDERS